MKEIDLLKVIIHKIVSIEKKMIKQDDLEDHLFEQEEYLKNIEKRLKEMKINMEIKHMENINSDDMLLRSILESKEVQYK
ncbi:hypothetical protein [Salipaludibacillus daqingensis]|uniref:hypothetical protein n=1 Tax=Salipaludibacillus daqingensis TaxID=3041001 RepID=UPI002476126E|nr:hypothetical protein [Salipaludibacillus daqingensis]